MRIQVEERGKVVDAVEVKLILGILEGAFATGARLPGEARLGRELGVSRPDAEECSQSAHFSRTS